MTDADNTLTSVLAIAAASLACRAGSQPLLTY